MSEVVTVELNQSHYWILLRALAMLTSRAGEKVLTSEFPNIDFHEMSADVMALCDQMENKVPDSWLMK